MNEIDINFMPSSVEECKKYSVSQLIKTNLFKEIEDGYKLCKDELYKVLVKEANRKKGISNGDYNLSEVYKSYMKLPLTQIRKLECYKKIKGRSTMTKEDLCKALSELDPNVPDKCTTSRLTVKPSKSLKGNANNNLPPPKISSKSNKYYIDNISDKKEKIKSCVTLVPTLPNISNGPKLNINKKIPELKIIVPNLNNKIDHANN